MPRGNRVDLVEDGDFLGPYGTGQQAKCRQDLQRVFPADAALQALHATPGGEEAVIIGDVRSQPECAVLVTTLYGGSRIIDILVGDPLPRIC